MKHLIAAGALALSATAGFAQTAQITTAEERAGSLGAEDNFTGTVLVEPVFGPEMANVNAGLVTFMPSARSHWHTHPSGQWLIVTSGTGWVQVRGEEKQTVSAGDVVWFPADVDHWHGATDENPMSHYAVQEAVDGSAVSWGDPVTDAEYAQ